jgi:hypothetical protein
MADKIIAIGPRGSIKKKLHDLGDGSYADVVYAEGISLEGDVNLDIPEMRALTNADVVTAELSAVDNAVLDSIATALTDFATDEDGNLQVDIADAVTVTGEDLQAIADTLTGAIDGEGNLQVDVLSFPSSNGKTRVSKRVSFGASETGTVVWTPATGKKFVLSQLIVSAKTAGDVEFFDGTNSGNTVIGPTLSLTAGGGWSGAWTSDNPYRSAAANNVLKLSTGSGITGSVYVEGFEE